MIKINLAPYEEVENQLWWVPDLTVAFIALGAMLLFVDLYLDVRGEELKSVTIQISDLQDSLNAVRSQGSEFDNLQKEISSLDSIKKSLSQITQSKLAKFLPIITLEHIQNLKPDGLWLTSLNTNTATKTIEVQGRAYSNVLIAEFMAALKSTKFQDPDSRDVRTLVYFSKVTLVEAAGEVQGGGEGSILREIYRFSIQLNYDTREVDETNQNISLDLERIPNTTVF